MSKKQLKPSKVAVRIFSLMMFYAKVHVPNTYALLMPLMF